MAFSKEKLQPSEKTIKNSSPIIFNDVRSSSLHKTRRNRECFGCTKQIEKDELYINHQFRYDKKILTTSFHLDCF